MPLYLSDIKIVDLKRSELDKELSDPKKGKYKFKKKVYIKQSDYEDGSVRPQHILKFVAYDKSDDYAGLLNYQRRWQAEPVTISDPYWPEPLRPNADGQYTFSDVILVKIPLEIWIDKRIEDINRFDDGHKLVDRQFEGQKRAMGAQLKDGDL